MKTGKPITTPEGEVREDLSDEELALFRPAADVLPHELQWLLSSAPPR